jgi:hypothetical protein
LQLFLSHFIILKFGKSKNDMLQTEFAKLDAN